MTPAGSIIIAAGSLLFCAAPGAGGSAFSEAITGATGSGFDHVGIAVSADSVAEASPRHGVVVRSLADFLADNGEVTVVDALPDLDTAGLRARIAALEGRPYDDRFMPGDDALYCSELVEVVYLDTTGRPLFTPEPMNFYNADGTLSPFWLELFPEGVPQGVAGTNPNLLYHQATVKTL